MVHLKRISSAVATLLLIGLLAPTAESQQPLRKALRACVDGSCLVQSRQQVEVNAYVPPVAQVAPVTVYAAPNCTCANCNCQLGVGQIDKDGLVITSVGPVASMAPQAEIMARRSDFRATFLKAVKQARDKGEITAFQHGRLVVAALRPRELANIQSWVHENAIQEGLASAQAPDWDAIISFIEKLIPLIIQLIDLFSAIQPNIEAQYVLNAKTPEVRTSCDWTWIGLAS